LRWRHKETHLVPAWPLHPDALKHAVPPAAFFASVEAFMADLFAASGAAQAVALPQIGRSS
jgi:hypothetical protein